VTIVLQSDKLTAQQDEQAKDIYYPPNYKAERSAAQVHAQQILDLWLSLFPDASQKVTDLIEHLQDQRKRQPNQLQRDLPEEGQTQSPSNFFDHGNGHMQFYHDNEQQYRLNNGVGPWEGPRPDHPDYDGGESDGEYIPPLPVNAYCADDDFGKGDKCIQ
jgi:hypothetical protein